MIPAIRLMLCEEIITYPPPPPMGNFWVDDSGDLMVTDDGSELVFFDG